MTGALFDLEPHGTPCLICGELGCVCRSAGTLAATPGAWPIDPTPATPARDSEQEPGCSCEEDPDGFGLYDADGWPCGHG